LKAFVADIAQKTGKGRSTVARDVTRAKKVAVLDDIAGTCLDKGDEIDALGKLPEGEQRKLATAARAGEKVSAKARKPRQKGADTAVRTTTAEVDADPAASAERRKRAYAADEPEREAMTAKDAALREFDGHVLRLPQIINRAEPERFARTRVDVDKLLQLSRFLAEVAGQQPQCADGHPAAVPITEEEAPRKNGSTRRAGKLGDVPDVGAALSPHGQWLDSGVELDAMPKLPEAEQHKLATAAKAGRKVSARQHTKKLKRESKGKVKPPLTLLGSGMRTTRRPAQSDRSEHTRRTSPNAKR
jgi:hypothetical protein